MISGKTVNFLQKSCNYKEIIALRQLEDYVLKIENDQIQLFKEDMQYIDIKLSDLTMKDFYSIEKKNILITSLKFDYTDRIIKIKSITCFQIKYGCDKK